MQDENHFSFFRRLYVYQKERFPVLGHGIMILAFTFSAVSYSLICRGVNEFISIQDFLIGAFVTFSLFFFLRVSDEHKDQEDDRKYRSYLPVPRGLISLSELRKVAFVLFVAQLTLLLVFQQSMLVLYAMVLLYLFFMFVEFFVSTWLKKRLFLYALSHMVIIPLVDLYASGLDWRLAGAEPHWGLAWFFSVSYFNGMVLEIGRKIRIADQEEEGVLSYSKVFGQRKSIIVWLFLLFSTCLLAIGASFYAGYGLPALLFFIMLFVMCCIPAILSLRDLTNSKHTKLIEKAAGIWTILMYLSLGAIPMIIQFIQ